ncbi:HTTM domain-containing protein [Pedobacter sp. KBW06]|uniref:HTTM domain-containing protein n=1 Tax=Pedobacter sp. KBW06 TaxID=2153359 RepID=UPI000F5B791F|nr:HTTM domain-containing protein [Pedobacter sp. KBW06]RQO75205.1 HTTM domain-containing protein [Pedobacter sp. KBW06]
MNNYFRKSTHAAPIAIYRIAIGLMLFISIIRFWTKGWIADLYIKPLHFFSFYGLEFIRPLGNYTYLLFFVCAVAALMVALGLFYRLASILLFFSFTYIELMDRSTYLNHYYFMSLVLFMLMFLPAGRYFSVDAYRKPALLADQVPKWNIDVLKLMMVILYFYAGLAKINSDWLLSALPLKIWLPSRNDLPLIGWLFDYPATAFLFSWFGCLYDLSIAFLLWNKKTRPFAYLTVVVFHVLTAVLFPIGMFPYVMIVAALIFFSAEFHLRIIRFFNKLFKLPARFIHPEQKLNYPPLSQNILLSLFGLFFFLQLLIPFRYLLYPGELFWTEQGYRFSWRVMLIEKAGYAQFTIKDATGKFAVANNNEFLTVLQEKMMSTQPDMILQYAHVLRDHYARLGFKSPEVYVDSYVTLNGRSGKVFINPHTDLAKENDSFKPKSWILPMNDEIKGF